MPDTSFSSMSRLWCVVVSRESFAAIIGYKGSGCSRRNPGCEDYAGMIACSIDKGDVSDFSSTLVDLRQEYRSPGGH
jgi:hypothetical protein